MWRKCTEPISANQFPGVDFSTSMSASLPRLAQFCIYCCVPPHLWITCIASLCVSASLSFLSLSFSLWLLTEIRWEKQMSQRFTRAQYILWFGGKKRKMETANPPQRPWANKWHVCEKKSCDTHLVTGHHLRKCSTSLIWTFWQTVTRKQKKYLEARCHNKPRLD